MYDHRSPSKVRTLLEEDTIRLEKIRRMSAKVINESTALSAFREFYGLQAYTPYIPTVAEAMRRVQEARGELISFGDGLVAAGEFSAAAGHAEQLQDVFGGDADVTRLSANIAAAKKARQRQADERQGRQAFDWKRKDEPVETKWSTFKAGYRQVPNPSYTDAALKYQRADAVYRRSLYGTGLLGALDMIISRSALDSARNTLTSTPQFLDEPVYQPYNYSTQLVREEGKVSLEVRLVDLREKQV